MEKYFGIGRLIKMYIVQMFRVKNLIDSFECDKYYIYDGCAGRVIEFLMLDRSMRIYVCEPGVYVDLKFVDQVK
jgi:hypothetical protein